METIFVKVKYSDDYVGYMTLFYGEHQKDIWEVQPYNARIILEQRVLWHRKMWHIPDSEKAHFKEWCILGEIYVLPQFRTYGIGRALFSYFIQFCDMNGLMKIVEGPISDGGNAMIEKLGLEKNTDWYEYLHNTWRPTEESLLRLSFMTESQIHHEKEFLIDWYIK